MAPTVGDVGLEAELGRMELGLGGEFGPGGGRNASVRLQPAQAGCTSSFPSDLFHFAPIILDLSLTFICKPETHIK